MTDLITVNDGTAAELLKVREYEERVDGLSGELAWIEEEYQSLDAKLSQFKTHYLDRLSSLFHFNDILETAIKSEEFRRNPDKHSSDDAYGLPGENWDKQHEKDNASSGAEITPEIRSAYREAMKAVHPDLASDDEERKYRTFMAKKINEAYAKGDIDLINSLLEDFKLSIRARADDDILAKRLLLLMRQELALKRRIEERRQELERLRGSEISTLQVEFTSNFETEEESFAALADTILNTIASNARRAAILGLVPDGFKQQAYAR